MNEQTPLQLADAILAKAKLEAAAVLARTQIDDALQKRDIEDLTKKVEEGFRGVHDRQDLTNGRIAKAESKIEALDDAAILRMAERKYERLIWYGFTMAISAIIALASFIVFHH